MKKITLLLLFVATNLFAQSKVSTSEEEYNYLTQGYSKTIEAGLDIKSGYELVKIEDQKSNDFSAQYYLFNHKETTETRALLIVLKKDKGDKDKTRYLCIPINNKELFKKYYSSVEELGVSMQDMLHLCNDVILMKLLDKTCNKK